jgi:hypothetical protein
MGTKVLTLITLTTKTAMKVNTAAMGVTALQLGFTTAAVAPEVQAVRRVAMANTAVPVGQAEAAVVAACNLSL